jgi:hypothetical protein
MHIQPATVMTREAFFKCRSVFSTALRSRQWGL